MKARANSYQFTQVLLVDSLLVKLWLARTPCMSSCKAWLPMNPPAGKACALFKSDTWQASRLRSFISRIRSVCVVFVYYKCVCMRCLANVITLWSTHRTRPCRPKGNTTGSPNSRQFRSSPRSRGSGDFAPASTVCPWRSRRTLPHPSSGSALCPACARVHPCVWV